LSEALAYAATSKTSPMAPITISRREPRFLQARAENGVVAETETIPIQEIETAFARMVKNDVKYRFVVDMKSLKRNV
jgi:D-arabinose 1-dehydrogenase-like Zn-dependent alcohol dehydrogenase